MSDPTAEFQEHQRAAHAVLCARWANKRGVPIDQVPADIRTMLWRGDIVGLDSMQLWEITGDSWKPGEQPTLPAPAQGATLDEAVAFLREKLPHLNASDLLREGRRLQGKPLPDVDEPARNRTQERAELRERLTAKSTREMREHRAKFGLEDHR